MTTDDPRLTAYALDECDHLEPEDRAEIAKALAEDPALSSEVEELRKLTTSLRAELHAEKSVGLNEKRRAEVLAASTSTVNKVVVPSHRAWWRAEIVGLSIAACAVIGLSTTVYYQAEHVHRLEVERERLIERKNAVANSAGVPIQVELGEKDVDSTSLATTADAPAVALTDLAAPTPTTATPTTTWAAEMPVAPEGLMTGSSNLPYHRGLGIVPAAEPAAKQPTSFGLQPAAPASGPQASGGLPAELYFKTDGSTALGRGFQAVPGQMPAKPAATPRPVTVTTASSTMRGRVTAGKTVLDVRRKPAEDSLAAASAPAPAVALALGFGDSLPELRQQLAEGEKALRERTKTDHMVKLEKKADDFAEAMPDAPRTEPELEKLSKQVEELRLRVQEKQEGESNTEAYDAIKDNPFLTVLQNPLSTFSIDVDTASYSNVRRFLNSNQRPPKGAVRIEELVNYFRYDYPQPKEKDPFGATMEVATCPWAPEHRLVRVGIKGREIPRNERPAANLVFLVDVSGSMEPENKLPLVKESLRLLTDQLGADDSVSIAVYAGASGCVLEPTHDKEKVRTALAKLESGGSTNGAAGIQLAYDLAQRAFKKGGSNRVILCTDGDFNVGMTDQSQLVSMIEGKAKTGIFLSVLGFGYGNLKDSTLEKLADKGNGFYGYIDSIAEGRRLFVEQLAGTLCTIAKDVKIQVEFNPTQVASYRLIGYENRLLAKEDFNDDTKDAGEIGAGHTVTALYEVLPAGKAVVGQAAVDELKYQPLKPNAAEATKSDGSSSELLTVKIRYKQPEGDKSTKVEFPLTDSGATWEKSTRDFRWAAAVAGFGMMLRDSPHKGSLSWSLVEELTAEGRAEQGNAERAEFVKLVDSARALGR